jgi:hypothetical protein
MGRKNSMKMSAACAGIISEMFLSLLAGLGLNGTKTPPLSSVVPADFDGAAASSCHFGASARIRPENNAQGSREKSALFQSSGRNLKNSEELSVKPVADSDCA